MSDPMISMLAMLAGELVLLLLVLLSIAWFRGRAARRRDERAIRLLVTRVRNSRTERETGIGRFLDERMGLSGEDLAQAKSAILQSELVLLKRFAELYRRRDADGAARFDADLVTALTPYHELKADDVVVAIEPAPVDDSELEKLREQNQLLSDELSVNMETMSKMLREFSTMFGGSPGDAAAAISTAAAGLPHEPTGDQVKATSTVAESGEGEASAQTQAASDGALKADAEAKEQATAEPVGITAQDTSGTAVTSEPQTDDIGDAAGSDATAGDAEPKMSAQASVQVEAGDDLGDVAELLEEEGPAEVVTFDDPEEFDVEVAQSGGEGFHAEESETPAEVQAQDGELLAQVEDADTPELDESFDVVDEEPLKAQSQG